MVKNTVSRSMKGSQSTDSCNPNLVTPDKTTSSLAQGPAALTCLVQLEKISGSAPPVTAFVPPPMVAKPFHFDLSDSLDSQHSTTRQENSYV